jgi:hypothetical protein
MVDHCHVADAKAQLLDQHRHRLQFSGIYNSNGPGRQVYSYSSVGIQSFLHYFASAHIQEKTLTGIANLERVRRKRLK